jgi:hypothetical protein
VRPRSVVEHQDTSARRRGVRLVWRLLAVPMFAAFALLSTALLASPAWAAPSGEAGPANCSAGGAAVIGACGNPAVSTPGTSSGSSSTPGGGGGGGGGGGSHAPGGGPSAPPSPPPALVPVGSPVCSNGTCTQNYATNPVCQTGAACSAPPSGLKCAVYQIAGRSGGVICASTYKQPSSTSQGQALIGYSWGGGIQPGDMAVSRWVVNYEGQVYTYPGSWNLVTSDIQAVCDGQPTGGTVEFYLTPPPSSYASPPAGWHWQSSPPPAPSLGPYPAGSFSIPACAPDRQQAIQSVTLAPSSNMEAAPTVQNGAQVVANGQTHIFEFVPQVRCPASDPKCGAGLFLQWDGGTAEITNYSPTVLAGVPYPRWESGSASPSWTPGPGHVPNQQVPFGYQGYQPGQTDKLPVFLYTETVGASYNSSGTSYLEEPYVNVGFHAPTYAGDPYQLHISGTYTATWSQYSFYVTAAASWNRVNPTSEVLVRDTPVCGGYYYKTVRISKHKTEQIPVCDDWYYPQSTVTWFQPEFQTAQYASAATGIDNTNTEVFPVSATADIGAVQVQIISGVG